jgi:hypothetical protein
LTGRSGKRADDTVQRIVLVRIGQQNLTISSSSTPGNDKASSTHTVVLGGHVTLNSLSIIGTPLVDVCSGVITTNKGDCPDFWSIKNTVDRVVSPVDDIEHSVWDTSFLSELSEDHGCTGGSFRRFKYEGVSRGEGGRDRPEWDCYQHTHQSKDLSLTHGGKVEGANGGGYAERVSDTVRVHVLGDFDVFSLEQCWDCRQGIDDLETSENISHSVCVGFPLLQCDIGRNFGLVLPDQSLVPAISHALHGPRNITHLKRMF